MLAPWRQNPPEPAIRQGMGTRDDAGDKQESRRDGHLNVGAEGYGARAEVQDPAAGHSSPKVKLAFHVWALLPVRVMTLPTGRWRGHRR